MPINLLQRQQAVADTAAVMKNLLTEQQEMRKEQRAVGALRCRFVIAIVYVALFYCMLLQIEKHNAYVCTYVYVCMYACT